MTKQLLHAALAAVAAMTFSACGQGGGGQSATTGTVQLTITGRQAMTGVTRVAISVAPAGAAVDLTLDLATGAFSGTLALPVGDQVITARAYAGATLVAEGSASVTVAGGQTLSITIAVLDVTGPEPTPDHSPVLTALSASLATLDVGQTLTLSTAAIDIDGDPITFTWAASPVGCATFSAASSVSSSAASTTATAALSGACTLTVEASAKGLSDTLSTSVEILLPVVIGGLYVPQPTIASVEFLSPATATVLRSDTDATVRHAWEAGTPVSVRFSWDDAPWLDRSQASLVDSCGGAITSTATTASSETFDWTPTGGAVCTLTASVDRQGLVDAFPVAVIVGPPSSCTWTLAESASLATAPVGAELSFAGGTVTYGTAFGREALTMAVSWGLLRIPSALTSESFAVEVDIYTPSSAPGPAGITSFSDWGPPPVWRTHGVNLFLYEPSPGTTELVTQFYRAGDACNGWAQSDCYLPPGGNRRVVPIPSFSNAWRKLRVEGNRSSCIFSTSLDGVLLDTYAGYCDATGTGFFLEGHGTSAFSNYRVYSGGAGCSASP